MANAVVASIGRAKRVLLELINIYESLLKQLLVAFVVWILINQSEDSKLIEYYLINSVVQIGLLLNWIEEF